MYSLWKYYHVKFVNLKMPYFTVYFIDSTFVLGKFSLEVFSCRIIVYSCDIMAVNFIVNCIVI